VSVLQPSGAAPEGGIAAVVVLAAGQGTRMRSATPKVLHALGGRSMLGHVLAATAPLAPRHTLVVVGAGREAVEEHLARVAPGARPSPTSRVRCCWSTATPRCCAPGR
jgi:bifunctional UDP-N-acetylglucosamine pyrophosphorylase/glucosamine-1-phosphate N-acetyltransferase